MSIPVKSPLNMGSQKIVSLLDPTSAQDAATKSYVDNNAGQFTVVTKTSTYTANNREDVWCSSGTFTVTLPTTTAGFRVNVNNQGTGVITVSPATGLINGDSTATLDFQYTSVTFVSDGTNWSME